MAVDVSAVVADVGAQAEPILTVGFAVLSIYLGLQAHRWCMAAIGYARGGSGGASDSVAVFDAAEVIAKEDRKSAEFYAAAADHGGRDGLVQHMDAVEASYHRMWAEQATSVVSAPVADSSPAVTFGRTYDEALSAYWSFTSEERALTDKLQAMGNSLEEAVHKMDLRADAISRGVVRARGYE